MISGAAGGRPQGEKSTHLALVVGRVESVAMYEQGPERERD